MYQCELSIIIPAYHEEKTVGIVVEAIQQHLETASYTWEIIVVDDGSTDKTGPVAAKAGATVITHPYNKGYGASLKTGIRAAQGNTVLFLDVDGQHRPEDITVLLKLREQYDMVVGARYGTAGSPLWRKPGKKILAFVVNQLVGRHVPDFNSGLRAMSRSLALRIMPLMPDGFSFSTTSTIACFRGGYNVGYVPIEVLNRQAGKSSVTWKDGLKTLLLIIRLITIFAPMRVILPASALCFLTGSWYILHSYITESQASVKGILMLVCALLIFFFGILLDQVSAIRRGEVIVGTNQATEHTDN